MTIKLFSKRAYEEQAGKKLKTILAAFLQNDLSTVLPKQSANLVELHKKSIEINLLPWRELRRKKARQQFIRISFVGLFIVILACLLVNYWVHQLVEKQQNSNRVLQIEIANLNKKLHKIKKIKEQKNRLINRILFFNKLQNERILFVNFFDNINRFLPKGVYLSRLVGAGMKITLEGFSDSTFSVSQLIKNIEANHGIKKSNLVEIKKDKALTDHYHFILNFILQSQNSDHKP